MDSNHEHALERIARLANEGRDLVSFWRACTQVLTAAVPHYWGPCWYTVDPASFLITSHFHEDLGEFPAEWLTSEYFGDDVHQIADVARSAPGISTLHEATSGDPSSSKRWQANMTMGADQELLLGLRTKAGDAWGALGLYREPGQPQFNAREKAFLRAAAPHLARGAQRALLFGEATEPEFSDAPGIVILDANGDMESASPGVARWLAELPDGDLAAGRLPSAIRAVAVTAAGTSAWNAGTDPAEAVVSRVRTLRGTWLVLHGARMVTENGVRISVIIEPAQPARISTLLMAAYELTQREEELTRLILRGHSSAEIAQSMVVSASTVQQHLKNIFDKTGVRSRRELAAKIFFAHYEPRFRENERRVAAGQPVRGGPALPAERKR